MLRRKPAGDAQRILFRALPGLRCPSDRTTIPYLPQHEVPGTSSNINETTREPLMKRALEVPRT